MSLNGPSTAAAMTGHTGKRSQAVVQGRFIAAVALTALGISIAACERPPLHVRRTGSTFVIDVQTLGEYLTSVRRIRLTREREVICETAESDDRYLVITPSSGGFRLDPGNDYELELWGVGVAMVPRLSQASPWP